MDYDALKAERDALRTEGVYRGIGLASFIEVTNPSAMFYGVGGARISAQDGATMRLDARGNVFVATGATEQGQGMEAVISQVAATAVGVPPERLKIVTGDTEHTPYGGGTWASRAAGIGRRGGGPGGPRPPAADPARGGGHAPGGGGEPGHPRRGRGGQGDRRGTHRPR